MRVLSIDPGHSTGVAVFNEAGEYELSINISDGAWNNGYLLNQLVALARPEIVLIEGIPSKVVDEKTAARFYNLERWFTVAGYKVYVVKPSEWKGLVQKSDIPSQHARDAARMGQWWMGGEEYAGQKQRNRRESSSNPLTAREFE